MSRHTSSQPQVQSSSTTSHSATTKIPHEKIAMRAYEKWVKRGQPHGTDVQDWVEAEAELKVELSGSCTTSAGCHTHHTTSSHHQHTTTHHHSTGARR